MRTWRGTQHECRISTTLQYDSPDPFFRLSLVSHDRASSEWLPFPRKEHNPITSPRKSFMLCWIDDHQLT